jgi:hypothetical protein
VTPEEQLRDRLAAIQKRINDTKATLDAAQKKSAAKNKQES